ncbi:MAG: M81 family metallopeptidase, partial [Alphaproteobacteria bacterium]|nr:M81 family metallopeptidase [Alphaproteobacteria bacterium]
ANGGSGGRVAAATYQQLTGELLERLAAARPVDGVYLALHGAFIAVGLDDVEGDLLSAARAHLGPDVPISVSCDLHAHVTPAMMRLADILIGYQHYPHDDTYETGRRAAGLLIGKLAGKFRPIMRARRAPLLLPAQKQRTKGNGPMARAFARARAREATGEVLAASYFCVQPWLDLPQLGYTSVVVTDDDPDGADRVALDMTERAWADRHEFAVPTIAPADAIRQGLARSGGPIVLADPSDCVGGGASGDSAVALRALLEAGENVPAAMQIVDPQAVAASIAAGIGNSLQIALGNKLDAVYGQPVMVKARVERLCDGHFTYAGGLMGGVTASMGASAVLAIGAIRVLATSQSAYEYGAEQFLAAGIDPSRFKFIVVKNPMNFQQAFADAPAHFTLSTPGPTTPDLARITWRRLSRPCYPIDDGFAPVFEIV